MILNDNIKKKLVMAYNAYIRRSKSEVRVMEILENCVMKSRFFVLFFLSRSLTYHRSIHIGCPMYTYVA